MTSIGNSSDHRPVAGEIHSDSIYRAPLAMAAGVLLLALTVWLCGDAVIRGTLFARLTAVAALLTVVPLVTAFTLRPAVFVGPHRMRVRNPFRTIELPWSSVEGVRATLSTVVHTEDAKYQVWAIPVSLRDRKKAMRASAKGDGESARTDRIVRELNVLAEANGGSGESEEASGQPVVRWSYPVLVPLAVGLAGLLALFLAP